MVMQREDLPVPSMGRLVRGARGEMSIASWGDQQVGRVDTNAQRGPLRRSSGTARGMVCGPSVRTIDSRLAELPGQILAVLPAAMRQDRLLGQAVGAAIDAFVLTDGRAGAAAEAVAPLFAQLGEAHARNGGHAAALADLFQAVNVVVQKRLVRILRDPIRRDDLIALRERLIAFQASLRNHVEEGFRRTAAIVAMSDDERRARLSLITFGGHSAAELERLARLAGLDPGSRMLAIASVIAPLPESIRDRRDALASERGTEMLIPESWDLHEFASQLQGQAVAGPPAVLAEAANATNLSRRAADMLRDGSASDGRLLVPYSDLLADLLVGGNLLLTDLIVQKHLAELSGLSPSRRLDLAEMLLHSLERGIPTNQLARDLGIPPQTAHSRMQVLRTMFGDALDDPTQRLELIVALRATLPRWRADV